MLVGVVRIPRYGTSGHVRCPHARGGGPRIECFAPGLRKVVPMLVGVVRLLAC